ncbi:MOSC domain-containing protein YiiM [Nakamurella panacisegetis]|uniref:MOSC domain-containing protein YiiM n=1 Tax=Nakamurella panacisegetis TaxID=1090615 RepID=A0A1H0LPS5_9ACTN|nr:MOSC and FAD-binding oxidoreductase domain-containing protein [Nakamurella panacisegetis]SDO70177.1 MOSC domain-containing protein YiiM [Nakamurella panacisegetis]
MATLLSVNVGRPRDIAWNSRTVHTGIWKRPVDGPVMARRLNLDGDGQGDLEGHGGEQRAVMVYQAQSYDYWRQFLDRSDLTWGNFGENFTVDGLADEQVCIGDRYRIGEAEFEVTQPRTTCYRVGLRLGEPRMAALLVSEHRPGFYFRVLREGLVRPGDDIVRIGVAAQRISVADTDALLYLPDGTVDTMRRVLEVDALSPGWRESFRDLVARADQPQRERAIPSAPAWDGFRRMRVAELVHETARVTSVYLAGTGTEALPAPRPGQYLTLRLPGEPATVRSYSLSAVAPDHYRISVKRETQGVASTYINTALAVGDEVDVAAPRGAFVLTDAATPVVLFSAGIGVTPVLAMLSALAAQRSPRTVWWIHVTTSPGADALAEEARRLVEGLPAGHCHVFYTADAPEPLPSGASRGRPDGPALGVLGIPADADVYLCGPDGFMDAMTAAMIGLGVAGGHIHTERFASLSAINPGVVATGRPAPHVPAVLGTGPLVTFARAGLATAFDEKKASLLEMAEECDVPTRWSCRTGVCRTCSTPLLSGAVTYQLAPLTEPDPGEVLLCCTRPATDVVLDL